MKISVSYKSGRLDVFDTMSFCMSEPFKREGDNLLTEFQVLLDTETILAEGLILEVYWYDRRVKEDTVRSGKFNLPHAARQGGNRVRLASKNEVNDIVLVTVDGELALWRQGEHLINGIKFRNQEILCYSSAATESINQKASKLFDYLRKANPLLSEEEAAELLGYTIEAINDVNDAELASAEFSEGSESETFVASGGKHALGGLAQASEGGGGAQDEVAVPEADGGCPDFGEQEGGDYEFEEE